MKSEEQEHNNDDSKDGPISLQDPIPLDLTVDILTRLPVKSLLKFQYVSKTWCSIIRSKDFINSSVSMRSTPPSSRLLISFKNGQITNKNAEKRLFFFTSSQEEDESSSLVAKLDMTMASMDAYFYTRCVSVNGFICLSHNGRFMICNPSTRQVITLPEIAGNDLKSAFKYLGYDPVNDQYKAMCKFFSNSEEDQEHVVLTLGGDDKKPSWRHIEGAAENYFPLTRGICINGFVYYGALTPTQHKNKLIVCFDVRSERLSFINLPSSSTNNVHWDSTSALINYKGRIANVNIVSSLDDTRHSFDLWVLQDAKEHRWSMRNISFGRFWWDSFGEVPMSFQSTNKMGEIIIAPKFLPRSLGPFDIIYYNVEIDKFKEVKVVGVADDEDFRRCYGIGNYGNCQIFISPEHGENFTFL